MGENETSAFDPIFFLHHCFIDYTFWKWQERHSKTAPGSFDIISGVHPPYPGTYSTGLPKNPVFTQLTMSTPLAPFNKADGTPYTSLDVVDIKNQLGYDYAEGSLDIRVGIEHSPRVHHFKVARDLHREQISGSFVIRTYAKGPDTGDEEVEIGREAILSRWSVANCANCQGKTDARSIIPIYPELLEALDKHGEGKNVTYRAVIYTRDGTLLAGVDNVKIKPIVEDL
jgi:tyrosinase